MKTSKIIHSIMLTYKIANTLHLSCFVLLYLIFIFKELECIAGKLRFHCHKRQSLFQVSKDCRMGLNSSINLTSELMAIFQTL